MRSRPARSPPRWRRGDRTAELGSRRRRRKSRRRRCQMAIRDLRKHLEARDRPGVSAPRLSVRKPFPPAIVLSRTRRDALPPILGQGQGVERCEALRHESRQCERSRSSDPMLAVNQRAIGPRPNGGTRRRRPRPASWRKGCVVVGGKMQEVDVLPPQDLGVVTSFATEVDHGIDGVIAAQSLEVEFAKRPPTARRGVIQDTFTVIATQWMDDRQLSAGVAPEGYDLEASGNRSPCHRLRSKGSHTPGP